MKTTVRIGAAVAAAAVAIGTYAVTLPDPEASLSDIETSRAIDADLAESAPQQTVVNGWETNDLLAYLAAQQDDYAAQQNAMLLVLALIGAALLFSALGRRNSGSATTPASSVPAPVPAPAATPSPASGQTTPPHQAPGTTYRPQAT